MDDFVNFLPVLACDLYSRFFEDFFQMSKVTGRLDHRKQLMKVYLLWFLDRSKDSFRSLFVLVIVAS